MEVIFKWFGIWWINMQKFNFSYDKENDDLFLFSPKSKSKGSIDLGQIVLDFNNKKERGNPNDGSFRID